MYIETTKEEFRRVKAEYCDIDAPAPWDNKNLSLDFLLDESDIFEDNQYINVSDRYLGYIGTTICELDIEGNKLVFIPAKETDHKEICEQIEGLFNDPYKSETDADVVFIKFDREDGRIEIVSYFKKEEEGNNE